MAKLLFRIISNNKHYPLSVSFVRRYSSQVDVKSDFSSNAEDVSRMSTLFVPGRHGAEIYQIVKPVIDINYMTENLEKLKLSCYHRGIDIDLDNILKLTAEWIRVRDKYLSVVEKNQSILDQLHIASMAKEKDAFQPINEKKTKVLEEIYLEKMKVYDIEDIVMPLLKKIPHVLHTDTPLESSVFETFHKSLFCDTEVKSHANILKHLLHFTNCPSTSYFMTGKLSELELAIQQYFTDKLNEHEFLQLSCVDFCKSFIIEAIGYDPYSCIKIKEKESREIGQKLHLVGAASFETFCAYFSNMNLNKSLLPQKYFSVGRRYDAKYKGNSLKNLFSVVQSSNLHFLTLSNSPSDDTFNVQLQLVKEWYTELGIPFRIVSIDAKNLTIAESHRKQLELWSPSLKSYVPVAYVSQHDDFVSKRLQITYGIQYIKEGYCHIIEGAVVNAPVLIGCIVENCQSSDNDFNIPNVLEKYLFT